MGRRLDWFLAPEGGSDVHFLLGLLRRCLEDVCAESPAEIDIPDGLDLRQSKGYSRSPGAIAKLLSGQPGHWLIFVHVDGATEPEVNRATHASPILESLPAGSVGVAVVPVRETEAWMLADAPCLARLLGSSERSLVEHGLATTPSAIERHPDPKELLNRLYSSVTPRRRRTAVPFERLGENVSLDTLRGLSAFGTFEDDLRGCLVGLGILPQ